VDQLSPELRELKQRMKSFVNETIIPREPELMQEDAGSDAAMSELKQQAKSAGLWALGHPGFHLWILSISMKLSEGLIGAQKL
jgi:alkylation response protein AidB-like acyl-CoA dehydrogenase